MFIISSWGHLIFTRKFDNSNMHFDQIMSPFLNWLNVDQLIHVKNNAHVPVCAVLNIGLHIVTCNVNPCHTRVASLSIPTAS